MSTIHHKCFRRAMVSLVVASVAGCVGTTKVEPSHPLMSATVESAKVYFIRPKSGFKGVADLPLTISLDGEKLLALSKGQYTLLSLASGTFEMKVESFTVMANGAMTSASTRAPVTFSRGETQYLLLSIISGGYTFAPFTLSEEQAVEAVQELTPIGRAVEEPIAPSSRAVSAPLGQPEAGKGLIVFYRESQFAGGGIPFTILDPSSTPPTKVVDLSNGSYFAFSVTPGKHRFVGTKSAILPSFNYNKTTLTEADYCDVNIESNTTYYVHAEMVRSGLITHPELAVVDPEQGSEAIKSLRPEALSQ